mmetsp:Transcript_102690/g.329155  ORF Transcript_102690/g.329155 Transcript_102690/m.329155 type:complete len:323 (-) Transcript_102690:185-1153(-)
MFGAEVSGRCACSSGVLGGHVRDAPPLHRGHPLPGPDQQSFGRALHVERPAVATSDDVLSGGVVLHQVVLVAHVPAVVQNTAVGADFADRRLISVKDPPRPDQLGQKGRPVAGPLRGRHVEPRGRGPALLGEGLGAPPPLGLGQRQQLRASLLQQRPSRRHLAPERGAPTARRRHARNRFGAGLVVGLAVRRRRRTRGTVSVHVVDVATRIRLGEEVRRGLAIRVVVLDVDLRVELLILDELTHSIQVLVLDRPRHPTCAGAGAGAEVPEALDMLRGLDLALEGRRREHRWARLLRVVPRRLAPRQRRRCHRCVVGCVRRGR